MFNKIL